MSINIPTTIIAILVGWLLARVNDYIGSRKEERTAKNLIIADLLYLRDEISKRKLIDNDLLNDGISGPGKPKMRNVLIESYNSGPKTLKQRFEKNYKDLRGIDTLAACKVESLVESYDILSGKLSTFNESKSEKFESLLELSTTMDTLFIDLIDQMTFKLARSINLLLYCKLRFYSKKNLISTNKTMELQKKIYESIHEVDD